MEILDPDLWNDDGTPKRPSKEYLESLDQAQTGSADAFMSFARMKRETKAERPPEVGDIVHYWDDGVCRAAIVMETETFGHGAMLRVHIPGQNFQDWQCDHSETKGVDDENQTWHWACGEGQ